MIEIGTTLIPRNADDPIVTVVGVAEPDAYALAPVEFGACPVFNMDFDQITASYDTTGHKVAIEPYDEAAEWRRLSTEVYHGQVREQLRNAKKAAEAEDPESYFRRIDAEAAVAKRDRECQ